MTRALWSEKKLQEEFRDQLKLLGSAATLTKIWQGPYSVKGVPDLTLVLLTVTCLIETKRYGEELDGAQEKYLMAHAEAKGVGGMMTINKDHTRFQLTFIVHDPDSGFLYQVPTSFPVKFNLDDLKQSLLAHPQIRKIHGPHW